MKFYLIDLLASILHSFLMGPQFQYNIHHNPCGGDRTLSSRSRTDWPISVQYFPLIATSSGVDMWPGMVQWNCRKGFRVLGFHFSPSGTGYGSWGFCLSLAAILREMGLERKLTLSQLKGITKPSGCSAKANLPPDFVVEHFNQFDLRVFLLLVA